MISEDLIQIFQDELRDLLESLDRCLLDLKAAPNDASLIAQVFRDLHTIKGNGGMFGFADLSAFVHKFENAFDKIRAGEADVTAEVIRLSLLARDEIPLLVSGQPDPEGRREAILNALQAEVGNAGDAATNLAPEAEEQEPVSTAHRLKFRLLGPVFDNGVRPELLIEELKGLGATNVQADGSALPNLVDLAVAESHLSWACDLPSTVTSAQVEEVFIFADAEWALTPMSDAGHDVPNDLDAQQTQDKAAESTAIAAPAKAPTALATAPNSAESPNSSAANSSATVRVPAMRLDALMDSVGELVIVEARLTELARQSRDPSLLATAEQITRLAAGLRDTTMTMRMVPMRTIVGRFRRLVSEAADSLHKPVQFVVEGEDTEFDKTLIEKLADPIVHLLRNAIDHGIEDADARAASGKSPVAKIALSAEQAGADILVRIQDDGRGLNLPRIRSKAVASGLISADAQLTDKQLYNLIFEPGFSTAGQVTEISGRGVGMDVVRRTIESLRGAISVDTEEGAGTTVTLRLPLTLAIIEGLLIETHGERYTIPMESVQEIVELPADRADPKQGGDFLDIRGQFVPFIRLNSLLSCRGARALHQNVVVINNGNEKVGLVVDRILGTNQVVIKQMSKLHRNVNVISGASILGDGSVALILDVAQLIAHARTEGFAPEPNTEVAA